MGKRALIPLPAKISAGGGGCSLSDGMVIAADEASRGVADLLATELSAATGWVVETAPPGGGSTSGTVRLRARGSRPDATAAGPNRAYWLHQRAEAYTLRVSEVGVEIDGGSPAGVFYGTRTLRQLMPADLMRLAPVRPVERVDLPGMQVDDEPRFAWRGIHLDVARHFFPKGFILKMVDLASLHKMNVLHLHLTDDQGWRLQVDRYPKLTQVGAWRRESPLGFLSQARGDGTPHGGFYTKADLSEIVAYAARRFVTVVPEVDMPGHMQAAIASYPELGNTGQPLEVLTTWAISKHVLNMGQAAVRFCADVLEEAMEVFPSPYVHIGGDECPTDEWQASLRAHELARERGIAGPADLQGWFTARIAEVVMARGKTPICWEEVIETGAPAGTVIVPWRQGKALAAAASAARAGHDVIMAPEEHTYFDWYYSDDPREPVGLDPVYRPGGTKPIISVEKAYGFEPVPEELAEALEGRVMGTQCQLWSEYIPTPGRAEYMAFPRASATAEVAWAGRQRNWEDFERRLRAHLVRLEAIGVNYRPLEGPTPGQAATWPV